MSLHIRKALIVYCSPAGATEHVALVIEKKLRSHDFPTTVMDLAKETDPDFILSQLKDAKDNLCIFLGSPVYSLHPLPAVMEFISNLPTANQGCALPFVTWGGVSSGTALHTMGEALEKKGYALLGAAKVLAQHSVMWTQDAPLGEGHPDAEDDKMIEDLVEKVCSKLNMDHPNRLSLSHLNYQSVAIRDRARTVSFEDAKSLFIPLEFNEEFCTQCGLCAEACPAEAIDLSPFPEIKPSCIYCYNCVKACPEEALSLDISKRCDLLRGMARKNNERPFTQVFI